MIEAMASITWSTTLTNKHLIIKTKFCDPKLKKLPHFSHKSTSINIRRKILPLQCTKLFPWEGSSPYPDEEDSNIIKGNNIVDPIHAEDSSEISTIRHEEDIIEMNEPIPQQQQQQEQTLKWPMWLLGPSVLLATGMVPTLWLPLSSAILEPNIAGLLSLVGLDCIFNIGATLFLLMAHTCAHGKPFHGVSVPLSYRIWNLSANLVGFLVPLLMLFSSYKGAVQPNITFLSFSVLLGPYLLLLAIQVLTEMLTWHWRSPVWLMTPIVYEGYRVLQLMRGLTLGGEMGAPTWAVTGIRMLVSWWVLVLAVQLMRVAWFAGLEARTAQQS